ncbi:M23 family metallopeptidase [Nocardioides sp. TF02-7]|uniref:peptidoglycan DD-metalloendopeptidase family protein n=1 Tax=Nocardioides sp. TF02-7 TaxID=2917724 RepID=UPI001F056E0A|nr:M23 family metallopeptidase [Nocardioides sp. TF02-7]UMG91612.1 peptidoglycan DD-metalloendopeptidase family protein [Nocardioides sp. TF02-7]
MVGQLRAARSRLQRVRTDLRAARVERARLARELAQAQDRLERVAAELDAAEADVAAQRDLLRRSVLDMETRGNPELAVMDAITSSGSIQEMLVAETGGEMILGREDQALTAFEAAEAALQHKKDEVKAARDEVAAQEEAARRNLLRIRGLYADAQATAQRVDRLVQQARSARRAAISARQADRAALERLEAREARIRRQLLALANRAGGPTYNGATGGLLSTPVNGPVTSPYGYRTHPIYGYYSLHNGTDFGAPCGAPLYAGRGGRVVNTYYDEVYGHRLFLSVGTVNGANLTLVYNHLSGYRVGEGAVVGRGDVVGYVGTTGWSTGCHLHFTVLRNGTPVNPMNYL